MWAAYLETVIGYLLYCCFAGEAFVEGSSQRWLEGESGVPVAAAAQAQDRLDPTPHLRRREHGGRLRQRVRLDPQRRPARSLLLLPGDDHLVRSGLPLQWSVGSPFPSTTSFP